MPRPRPRLLGIASALVLSAACGLASAAPVGTAFTYQGELTKLGAPVNGTADLRFTLFTQSIGGSPVGAAQTVSAVGVTDGLFSTQVDFGVDAYATDQEYWLQIEVRNPAGGGAFSLLGARQRMSAAPYSMATRGISVNPFGVVSFRELQTAGSNGASFGVTDWAVGSGSAAGTQVVNQSIGNNAGPQFRFQSSFAASLFMDIGQNSVGDFVVEGNDTARMVVKHNGNVGIGETNPLRALHLKGNDVGLTLQDTTDADGANARWALDTQAFGLPGIALVRYDASGSNSNKSIFVSDGGTVGIGITPSTSKLDVNGSARVRGPAVVDSDLTVSNGTTYFNGFEHRFDGYFSLNRNFDANVNAAFGTGGRTWATYAYGPAGGTLPWNSTSDRRLKDDIESISDSMECVRALRGVTFEWRREEFPDKQYPAGRQLGFIAQEVRDVLPEVVTESPDGLLGITYTGLIPVLTEAIKAQDLQIRALEARLAQIEAILAASDKRTASK